MKKRVLSLTALVLIGLSSTFGSTFSATEIDTYSSSESTPYEGHRIALIIDFVLISGTVNM